MDARLRRLRPTDRRRNFGWASFRRTDDDSIGVGDRIQATLHAMLEADGIEENMLAKSIMARRGRGIEPKYAMGASALKTYPAA